MTGDSFDWLVDSQEQAAYRRLGSAIAGDATGLPGPTGLLEDKWSPRARQMIELHSLSLTDGYPTYACLYTNESTIRGTVYARSTNGGGANYQLGKEFGSTHYPATAGGASVPLWKCYPLWSENATTSYFRGCSATQRKLFASGARRMLEVGDWLYIPANTGMPIRWNRRWNDSTSSGTEPNRIQPWGRQPPLFPPDIESTTATAGSDSNWLDGDCFYVSVMFEFSDGSFSMPWIPRTKGTNGLTAVQAGLVEVGTVAGGAKYRYITMRNLPLGPDDCVARWVLTSPKQTLAATTDTITIQPLDLRVAEIVRNNTSTKFKLFGPGETVDDLRVRFDHKWAWRAQVACGADQRVIIGGKMKPNPAAIILAPTGFAASRDYNVADSYAVGNNWTLVRITGTSLQLRYLAAVPGNPAATTTTITLSSAKTLQDIVDEINATVYTGVAQEWAAQVVPGTDPGIISTYLADTTLQRGGAAATDAWGDDTGVVSDGTSGNCRAYHPNLPAILYLNDTYLAQYPADRQRIEFTGGGPGSPPSVANNFYTANFRYPPNRGVGDFVGAASITPTAGITAIVCYERGIYSFRNIRGGGTGEDNDYRLLPINESRGCISFSSIIAGNGWVGYMTRDGFVITDGEREVLTSLDLWNAEKAGGAGVGIWQYEVNQSVAAVSKGGDDSYFHAMVSGSQVRVNYRASSASSTQGNRGVQYDFSGSPASNGIQEVVQPDGSPFGWSCPIRQSFGPMCRISKSTGWAYYAAVESADSAFSTGSGRIDQFNTGTSDSGNVQINSPMYLATDLCDSMKKKSAVNVGLLYANADSGLTCRVYRGPSRTNYSDLVIPTGSDIFTRKLIPLPAAARSRGDSVEIRITDDGSGVSSPTPKIWTVWLDVDVLDSDD